MADVVATDNPWEQNIYNLLTNGKQNVNVDWNAVQHNMDTPLAPVQPFAPNDPMQPLRDLTAKLGQPPPSTIQEYLKQATDLAPKAIPPSRYTEAAAETEAQRAGNAKLLEMLLQTPIPPAQHVQRDEVAPLQLPNAPVAEPNRMNGIAQLAAGIAGLFHPQAAGEFGAAAMEGAARATQQRNQQTQAQFQNTVERLTAIHRDAIERADAKLRVDAINQQADETRTHEQAQRDMLTAKTAAENATLTGQAKAQADYSKAETEAAQNKATVAGLENQAASQTQMYETEQKQALSAAEKLGQYDNAKTLLKQREDAAAEQKRLDREARAKEDKAKAEASMARTQAQIQSRERIAKGSQALQNKRIDLMKQYGLSGRNAKATMEHMDYTMKAAWSKVESAKQRLGQVEKSNDSPSPMDVRTADQRANDIIQAQKAYDAALQNFEAAGAANRARVSGGPMPVTPPPGAHIKKWNPVTGKLE